MKNKKIKFEIPYKIIKKQEYKNLLEAKKEFIKLCEKKKIEPLSDMEMIIMGSPLFQFGTRLLLRQFNKEKK